MKSLNYIAIGVSILLIGGSYYYMEEVASYRWVLFNYDASNKDQVIQLTTEIGLISLVPFIGFLVLFLANSRRKKTLSIFGVIFSGGMLLWDMLMLNSPTHISFDEVAPGWMIYGIISALFFALLNRKIKPKRVKEDVIDDIEFT